MIKGLAGGALVILAVVAAGFIGQRLFGSGPDSMAEAREAFESLPYGVSTHSVSDDVLVGTARGHLGDVVHFAVAAGEGWPRPPAGVPPRLIRLDKNVMGGGGFTAWEDGEAPHRGESRPMWEERSEIATAIEEALCRMATGEACPV
ncbi:MAG TPA: hypothetical protein VHS74_14320 [Solirubrobacterales bacterium]|jgi:hypothetical protein|nr:hypothetical protein [Solirubrobacterales bacterium]